ncbi:MAG: hypothetical protein JKX76_01850 [Colwellia sp.]|nr:hypothetical protein [Colwellia sp.]
MTIICLYSKFSNVSKQFLSKISNVDFIRPICIDNEKIRVAVANDKKLNITKVPTILVIHDDGLVEKFDNNVFEWLEEILVQTGQLEQSYSPINQPQLVPNESKLVSQPVQEMTQEVPAPLVPVGIPVQSVPVEPYVPQSLQGSQPSADTGIRRPENDGNPVSGLPDVYGSTPIQDEHGTMRIPHQDVAHNMTQDPSMAPVGGVVNQGIPDITNDAIAMGLAQANARTSLPIIPNPNAPTTMFETPPDNQQYNMPMTNPIQQAHVGQDEIVDLGTLIEDIDDVEMGDSGMRQIQEQQVAAIQQNTRGANLLAKAEQMQRERGQ